jgi:MFS family permease
VADITPPELRGAAYGLRQALDSVGAFVGPLLAVVLMAWLANDITSVLWIAVVPAFIAAALIALAVREPEKAESPSRREPLTFADAGRLPLAYWLIVMLGVVFTLARFSEAFLVLRAHDVGLALGHVPAVMIVMNVVYSTLAYPAGIAADRWHAPTLLIAGLAALVGADLVLAAAASPSHALMGAALWGLHMALTQGLLSKLVGDAAPAELRGTAFGIFNLASGGALLVASVMAGVLWSTLGPSATFIAGAAFAGLAGLGLLAHETMRRGRSRGA